MNSIKIGDYFLPSSLSLVDGIVRCRDCNCFEHDSRILVGGSMRHTSRCDVPAQPFKAKKSIARPVKKQASLEELKSAAKSHLGGVAVDSDKVFEAYQKGYLSMSDAMNSDF